MLGFLFRTLTAQPSRGTALFDAITAAARQPHWYIEGEVPAERFDAAHFVVPQQKRPGKIYTPAGGFLDTLIQVARVDYRCLLSSPVLDPRRAAAAS